MHGQRRWRTGVGIGTGRGVGVLVEAVVAIAALVGLAACSAGGADDAAAPAPTTVAAPATSVGSAGGEPPGDGATTAPSLAYTDPQLAVAFEPARRMTLGETTTVAVTVSIDEDGAFTSLVTSEPGAATSVASLGAGCRVSITLVAEPPGAFAFLPASPQAVDLCGADGPQATRTWAVRPLQAGQPLLGASYSVDGRDANTVPFRITVEDPATAAAPARGASSAPPQGSQGSAAGVVGLLAAVAAVAAVGGTVWWRRRRTGPSVDRRDGPASGPRPVRTGSPQVFLSYAREDAEAVGRLERVLGDAGLDAWRDIHDIGGGEDWMAKIAGAVGSSVALVLVLSPSCAQSEFVPSEVALAVKHGIPVVPVRIAGGEELHPALELAIARAQVVDLRGSSWPSGAMQLVQALRAAAARQGPFSLVDPVRPATPVDP